MKTTFTFSLLIIFLLAWYTNTKTEQTEIIPFFKLDMGNQDSLILFSKISVDSLNTIKSKYSWDQYDRFDNLLWCKYIEDNINMFMKIEK